MTPASVTSAVALAAAILLARPRAVAGRRTPGTPGGSQPPGRRPRRWRAPARHPPVDEATLALALDLVAAATEAGLPPAAAIAAAGAALGGDAGLELSQAARALALGVPAQRAWPASEKAWSSMQRVLALSQTSGAPVTALLREAAAAVRRDARHRAEVAAARLSVRIVLPLGLCALPAFFALGVIPLVMGLAAPLLS